MLKISSNQNPKYKLLKRLKQKKHRIKEALIILEGRRLIEHGISLGISPVNIFYRENILPIRESSSDFILEKALFDIISDTVNSQGIIGIFKVEDIKKSINPKSKNIIILNGIQDPGNLGTIVRTAEAFGFDRMILTKNTADPHSDKALRSSMGGVFGVDMIIGFENKDLINYLKKASFKIIVSSPSAILGLDVLKETLDNRDSYALIFGNEGNGADEIFIKNADIVYKIDMKGNAESLNVAAAASISMFELQNI